MSNTPRDDEGEFLPARLSRPLPAPYQSTQVLTGTISETDDVAVAMHYLGVLWKGKWILLLFTTLGLIAGFGASLWTTPLYSARTKLVIEEVPDPDPFRSKASGGMDLETEVQLLSSQTLADRVRTKLSEKNLPPPKHHDPLGSVRRFLG